MPDFSVRGGFVAVGVGVGAAVAEGVADGCTDGSGDPVVADGEADASLPVGRLDATGDAFTSEDLQPLRPITAAIATTASAARTGRR